jgi:hypothetical protein
VTRSTKESTKVPKFRNSNMMCVAFFILLGCDTYGDSIYQRIMGYIDSGKQEGATLHLGGQRFGDEGYFINPTIFTDTKPDMKIVKEEIFGPVGVVIKFEDEEGEL